MSKFEFRRLDKWKVGGVGDRMELGVPLPESEGGLVLRWCPNDDCTPRRFQIGNPTSVTSQNDSSLQRRPPGEPYFTCPYCGTDDDDSAFIAPEDVDAAIDQVAWAFEQDVGDWLSKLADDFNKSVNRGGKNFLNIEMTSSHRSKPPPRPWREDLLRTIECHQCSRSYGVYAIGFFCPDCGAANLAKHFEREAALVVAQVDIAERLSEEGHRELAFRILGNAHEDVVTGFETYLKSTFRLVTRSRAGANDLFAKKELKGNPFQNLRRASALFGKLKVVLFEDLETEELDELRRDFEKRHVVGHNLGMADEKYAEVAADTEVGETVPLLGSDIERFARTCVTVVKRLQESVPELHPAR